MECVLVLLKQNIKTFVSLNSSYYDALKIL